MTISIKIKNEVWYWLYTNKLITVQFLFLFANICVHVFDTYFRDTYRKKKHKIIHDFIPRKNNPSIVAIPYLEPDLDWELSFSFS